jgi:8-oxo-dGTP pyrophosphatase MutT (NUDIX family)
VIAYGDTTITHEYGTPHADASDVRGVVVVGYNPAADKWMGLEWGKLGTMWLVGGGQEEGETFEQNAIRELSEETGYTKYTEIIQLGGPIISHYYNEKKDSYRRSYSHAFLFILDSTTVGEQHLESHEDFTVVWHDYHELVAEIYKTGGGVEHWLAVLDTAQKYISEQTA